MLDFGEENSAQPPPIVQKFEPIQAKQTQLVKPEDKIKKNMEKKKEMKKE